MTNTNNYSDSNLPIILLAILFIVIIIMFGITLNDLREVNEELESIENKLDNVKYNVIDNTNDIGYIKLQVDDIHKAYITKD